MTLLNETDLNVAEYDRYFSAILNASVHWHPYDNPDMLHYVELNKSRHDRWMKKGELLPETIDIIKTIRKPLTWILITEPWCGDAAHSVPFILKMAEQSRTVNLELRLRDSEGSEIERYLTNGAKAIPLLIVRNEFGEDLFTWGPRPDEARLLRQRLTEHGSDPDTVKITLQKWYNVDQGRTLQKELTERLQEYVMK